MNGLRKSNNPYLSLRPKKFFGLRIQKMKMEIITTDKRKYNKNWSIKAA